jgi:hypothetical protein
MLYLVTWQGPVLKKLKPLEPSELHALEVKRKDFEAKVREWSTDPLWAAQWQAGTGNRCRRLP